MAAARKTKEQIIAERAAALKAFEKYQKTRPSKVEIAARNNAPVKPMTAAERAARTKAMEAIAPIIEPSINAMEAIAPIYESITPPAPGNAALPARPPGRRLSAIDAWVCTIAA